MSINTVSTVKTTPNFSDTQFFDTEQTAKAHQTKLLALFDVRLNRVLVEHYREIKTAFKLRNASVTGGGTFNVQAAGNAENESALERHLRVDAQMQQQDAA